MQHEVLYQIAGAASLEALHGRTAHVSTPQCFGLPGLHEYKDVRVIERLMQLVSYIGQLPKNSQCDQCRTTAT